MFKKGEMFRFVEKGKQKGEDMYLALGQTESGRYLAVLFIYKKTKEALILSARGVEKFVAIDPDFAEILTEIAKSKQTLSESLINLWLRKRIGKDVEMVR